MKLIDKLKNVFFEEVTEDEDEEELPQTFAKKVELPKRTVEIPKHGIEVPKEDDYEDEEEEEVIPATTHEHSKESTPVPQKEEREFPMMFDDEDFLEDKKQVEIDKPLMEKEEGTIPYLRRETRDYSDESNLYQGKKEMSYVESVNSRKNTYTTRSYYEDRDSKGFKPSPIISPIYGILDTNYRKEEVVTKKETRVVTTSYGKLDLDSVRNKAFGNDESSQIDLSKNVKADKEEKELSKEERKKVYDVNNNKPQVNRVTLADADEYYNDLGLAYNVDYSDASRNTTRSSKYNPKEKKKNDVDDNLFDLIDSMYNKED